MKDSATNSTLKRNRIGRPRRLRPAALLIAGLMPGVFASQFAAAQTIERLGEFNDWTSYKFTEKGNAGCYMASKPTKAEGKYTSRGDIYALVTHRPAEKRRDEVSIKAGYRYKEGTWVEVKIGSKAYKLFTQDDGAWTPDAKSDKSLVEAMIRGRNMVVKGVSEHGTETTDTYSLSGFTKAYKAINDACGF